MIKAEVVIKFNHLPRLSKNLEPLASEAVRKVGLDCEAIAKTLVPVRTGNLKNSIQTTMETPTTAVVGTNVIYGPFIEFGTRRMAARPFLLPAFERVKGPFIAAMRKLFG